MRFSKLIPPGELSSSPWPLRSSLRSSQVSRLFDTSICIRKTEVGNLPTAPIPDTEEALDGILAFCRITFVLSSKVLSLNSRPSVITFQFLNARAHSSVCAPKCGVPGTLLPTLPTGMRAPSPTSILLPSARPVNSLLFTLDALKDDGPPVGEEAPEVA